MLYDVEENKVLSSDEEVEKIKKQGQKTENYMKKYKDEGR